MSLPSADIIRRAVDEEVRTFDQFDEGEGRYYVFDGEHREQGPVKQRTEVYERVAARLDLIPERVKDVCPGLNYRPLFQRGTVLWGGQR